MLTLARIASFALLALSLLTLAHASPAARRAATNAERLAQQVQERQRAAAALEAERDAAGTDVARLRGALAGACLGGSRDGVCVSSSFI